MQITTNITSIRTHIPQGVTLVCVSKFHPMEAIMEAYECGERDFGESRVQELLPKYEALPKDIRWHFIGHLQTNKVKQIVPFVHMIHSVDSVRLLETINREAEKIQRRVKVLLEVHVAKEETKSGFTPEELLTLDIQLSTFNYVEICGLMGMATNTDDEAEWRRCFRAIASLASHLSPLASSPNSLIASSPIAHSSPSERPIAQRASYSLKEASYSSPSERPQISMGMSDDYLVAIEEGSTMVRIGSTIFGFRTSKL